VLPVTRTVAVDTKIDELASLRGRVGFAAWDNALFYGTGGLALAHASATSTITQTIGSLPAQISSSTASGTMLGWAAGVGLDYKVLPNMFVGLEYLHSDFPKNTFAFVDGKGGGFSLGNNHLQVDAIKARVGFLFN
jgi:outer membrane immunogenic protein